MNNSYGPLKNAIPLSLARQTAAPVLPTSDTRKPGEARIDDAAAGGSETDAAPGTYEEFVHPAAVEPQQVVWLPRDALGLADQEVAACRAHGVDASTAGAWMDAKGHVDVEGAPPGKDVRV